MHSNKLSRIKDGKNLRLSCPSGEELEMANINIMKNYPSIDSYAKQNSSSFCPGSFIFKRKILQSPMPIIIKSYDLR